MYQLRINGELLYKPGVEEISCVISPIVNLEINEAGKLVFGIDTKHPFYDKLFKHKTVIDLYDGDDWLYAFRVLDMEIDFNKVKQIECEGVLNFLLDSMQRPYEYKGSLKGFLTQVINGHNSQVDDYKKFSVGQVTVIDNNDYINRSNGYNSKTLNALKEKLVSTHGGYLRVRKNTSGYILDYISTYSNTNSQVIRFGETLLDLNQYITGRTIKTALIPLGAEIQNEEGINGVPKRVDIKSVNGNKDYIVSDVGVKLFGYIWDEIIFEDVTIPSNLLAKAKAYIAETANYDISIEVSAIDLSYVDVDIKTIRLGDMQPIESKPHDIQTSFLVSQLEIDIENPDQSLLTLGSNIKSFTSKTSDNKKEIGEIVKVTAQSAYAFINDAITNATNLLTGGGGGYVVTVLDSEDRPRETLYMDTPDVKTAKYVLRVNMNGIGFSQTGVNGPYTSAWTIDGKFNANFITAGTIRAARLNIDGIVANSITATNSTFENCSLTGLFTSRVGQYAQKVLITGDYIKLVLADKETLKIDVFSNSPHVEGDRTANIETPINVNLSIKSNGSTMLSNSGETIYLGGYERPLRLSGADIGLQVKVYADDQGFLKIK